MDILPRRKVSGRARTIYTRGAEGKPSRTSGGRHIAISRRKWHDTFVRVDVFSHLCMFILLFILRRSPENQYFNYDMHANKAYIYDWSSARHISLPDGTLENFGGTLQVN